MRGSVKRVDAVGDSTKNPGTCCLPAARRQIPMVDAYNTEAAQLQDGELDLRLNSQFNRVFGNGLFEDAPPSPQPKTPGTVKRNNLFEDPNRQNDQRFQRRDSTDHESTPDRGLGMSARKQGSTG